MKIKKCTKCKEEKLLSKFYDKHQPCKICFKKRQTEYRRTYDGHLRTTYTRALTRLRREKHYQDKCITFSWDQFKEWTKKSNYKKLYKNWVKNNYCKKLTPSLDRINNKGNYTLNNIQFITHSENVTKDQIGSDNHHAKLQEFQVETILWLFKNFDFNKTQLATMFGVSAATIRNIIHKKSWKHVTI